MTEEYLNLMSLKELHILMTESIFELLAMRENKKIPAIIIKDKQSQIELIHKIINAKKAENQTV